MSQPDLYATLGLTPAATKDEIAHAYRSLLRLHHPDTRPAGDSTQQARSDVALSQVIAAYAVLSDDERRHAYDRRHVAPARTTGIRPQQPVSRPRDATGSPSTPPIVAGPVWWTPPRRPTG